MSIILDALRKSDAARPAPEQQRLAPAPVTRRGPPAWLWLLLGIATISVISAALAIYLAAPGIREGTEAGAAGGQQQIMENDEARAEVRPLAEVARERSPQASSSGAQGDSVMEKGTESAAAVQPDSAGPGNRSDQGNELVAPWLKDLPAEYRIGVPQLAINALAYSDDPAKRFVLINLRRYAEGDRLQEGPRLLAIQEGAVILEYKNREFALPAR